MAGLGDIFTQSGGALIEANSAADLATSKQAVTDGQAAQASAFDAIKAKTSGPRVVGGGQYGVINQQRGNLVLGNIGGLANANRTAENLAEKANNQVVEQVTRGNGIMSNNPGWTRDNAAASQTAAGYARPSGINVDGFRTQISRYDESGTGTTTYR